MSAEGGRIFTFFVLIIGIGTIAIPSGIVASALGEARQMADSDTREARPD